MVNNFGADLIEYQTEFLPVSAAKTVLDSLINLFTCHTAISHPNRICEFERSKSGILQLFNTHTVFLFSDVLKELVLLSPHDFLHTLVPFLQHNHCTYHHSNIPSTYSSSTVLECGWHLIFLHTKAWRFIFSIYSYCTLLMS